MAEIVSKGICPITLKNVNELDEPVCAPDGWTYEKADIVKWLNEHGSSPMTREPMQIAQLCPNRIVQNNSDTGVSNKDPDISFILVAALDNSGSMGVEAEIVNANGKRERHGLSQLDLAKHALITVVESMKNDQMFGLCVWSSSARIELPVTRMNKEGRKKAIIKIKGIGIEGSTNLWEGIYTGCRLVDTPVTSNKSTDTAINRSVWILSDGNPNYDPPKSYEDMINEYNEEYGKTRVIRTLGFGTDIDSDLLSKIADYGDSSFSFVSDPGQVGTCIVHALANSQEGPVFPEDPILKILRENFVQCIENILTTCKQKSGRYGSEPLRESQLEDARKIYNNYLSISKPGNRCSFCPPFMETEITIGLASMENWQKWGAHYARSLLMAHKNRECNNFLDPSVQQYQECRSS